MTSHASTAHLPTVSLTDYPVCPDLDIFDWASIPTLPSWTDHSPDHPHPPHSISAHPDHPRPPPHPTSLLTILDNPLHFSSPPSPLSPLLEHDFCETRSTPFQPHPTAPHPPPPLQNLHPLHLPPHTPTPPEKPLPHSQHLIASPATTCASSIAESTSSQGSIPPSQILPTQPPHIPNLQTPSHAVIVNKRAAKGRVHKQMRRYSAPKSSRYCHLCARHQRCVEMVPCTNVELGLCQKSVCRKCINIYELPADDPSWSCPHCQNKCPKRAKCFAYDRQTARRREKTLQAKVNLLSVPTPYKKIALTQ